MKYRIAAAIILFIISANLTAFAQAGIAADAYSFFEPIAAPRHAISKPADSSKKKAVSPTGMVEQPGVAEHSESSSHVLPEPSLSQPIPASAVSHHPIQPHPKSIFPDERIPLEAFRSESGEIPVVIATRPIFYDFARRIAGTRWKVVYPESENSNDTDIDRLFRSAQIVLADPLPYPEWLSRRLKRVPENVRKNPGISSLRRPQRPSGEISIADISAGTDIRVARRISRLGLDPEPTGARLSEAVRIAGNIADILSERDPDGKRIYRDRAWKIASQMIALRALATDRSEGWSDVDVWVTDGYAMAIAADIGLPVDRWIDRTFLSIPSGQRLEEMIRTHPADRPVVVLTTRPVSDNVELPPISPAIESRFPIMEIQLEPLTGQKIMSEGYLRIQAMNYDRIFQAGESEADREAESDEDSDSQNESPVPE